MRNRTQVPCLPGECHAARPLRRLTVTFIITLRAGICHIHHPSMQELLHNSDLRLGLTFDCNYQALLDRGAILLIQFNAFRNLLLCGDILKKKPISPSGFAFERWFIQSSTRTLLTLLFCSVVNCTCAFKWSMADPRYLWGGRQPLGGGCRETSLLNFPEQRMKFRIIWSQSWGTRQRPPLDPPLILVITFALLYVLPN